MDLSTTFASMRKKVAGISLVAMVAGLFATGVASAQTGNIFSDVPADAWYADYVNGLAEMGVVDATQDMYRPGDQVNRAEMAKLAFYVSGLPMETASAAPYKDVPMGQWYTNYIYTLTKNGIVSGDKKDGVPTGYFRPSDSLNRAEASKMLVNSAQMAEDLSGAPHFPDVTSTSWYYNFVETLFNNDVIDGYPDGMFRPGNFINRAEVAKMVYLSLNPMTGDFVLDSAAAASLTKVELIFSMNVAEASAENVDNYKIEDSTGTLLAVTGAEKVAGDTVHLTTAGQTKGKVYYVTASNVMSEAGDNLANNDEVSFLGFGADVSGGDLEVALSTQTPVAGSVPSGATGVVFTCWDFMAGADNVMVNSVHAHRVGPGSQTAFSDVYLYRGDQRLTTGRSINSETQMVEFNNINQEVAAGENMKLCLVADLVAGASGGVHAFEINAAADVMTNSSNMTGSFPLRGADQLITSAVVGTTTITKNGSLDELTVGQVGGRIAQFELEADGSEDQFLNRIALYVRGSVTVSDIKNLKLFTEGNATALASVSEVGQKDLATFVLSTPFKIGRGQKKIFYVTADLSPGRDGDNIKIYLDESTDLNVEGATFGYGTRVIDTTYDGGGTCPGVTCEASFVTIKGSTFNVSFTGPSAGEIAVGQNSARCLDMTITNGSGSAVEIKDWVVNITSTDDADAGDDTGLYNATNAANLTLVKLATINADGSVGGSLLGPAELPAFVAAGDASVLVTLTGSGNIDAGETLKTSVIFNVLNTPLMTGTKVRCTLQNLTTTPDSVRDVNGDALGAASITPSSNIVGNLMTVTDSSLSLSAASSPSSTTYSRGTMSAPLLGIQLKAGSALDQTVKSITLTGNASVGTLKDIIDSNVALYDAQTGGTAISEFKNISSTTPPTLTFNNLNIAVAKNQTKTIYLRGNVSNSAPTSIVQFFIALSTDVVSIDQNGQTTTGINVTGIDALADVPDMTISAAGSGSVGQSTTSKTYVAAAERTFEAARFKFTAKDGQATLQDLDLKVLNDSSASVKQVKLQKLEGSTCVDIAGSSTVSPLGNGMISFDNLQLSLSNTADTIVCAILTTNAVQSTGEPSSASNAGVVLYNVTQIDSGSGDNVVVRYVTDTTPITDLAMVGTNGLTAVDTSLTMTALATDDIDLTGSTLTAAMAATGTVIQIDEEMMLVTTGGASPLTVVRGFAGTAAASHAAGAAVGLSSVAGMTVLTDGAGSDGLAVGDVYVVVDATPDYCLVTGVVVTGAADTYTVEALPKDDATMSTCNATGTGEIDATQTVTTFKLHGPLSRLYRSVPVVTFDALPSTILSATTVLSKFTITPENSSVTFKNNGTNELTINYSASNATVSGNVCTLREVGGSNIDTTTAGAATIAFDFSDQATDYAVSAPTTFEVECAITAISSPASVSTQFIGTTDPILWFDGNVDVTGAGVALFPSSSSPQTTSAS